MLHYLYINLAIKASLIGQFQVVVPDEISKLLCCYKILFDGFTVQTILNPFFVRAEIKIYDDHNPK